MHPIVLASTSPYRRELFSRLGLPFTVEAPDVDETPHQGEEAHTLAARLAIAKTERVAARFPLALVIGSDQVATDGERLVGKPGGREAAITQLERASGGELVFHTAIALVAPGHKLLFEVDTCRVFFRRLSREQIERYVDREQPFDSAGAFRVEGLGIALFKRVEMDDPTALIGLPLIRLVRLLERAGVHVI